jgi:hypothetical protein
MAMEEFVIPTKLTTTALRRLRFRVKIQSGGFIVVNKT